MKKKLIEQMKAPRITKGMEGVVAIARIPAEGLLTIDFVDADTKEVEVRHCVTKTEFANYYPDTGIWDNKKLNNTNEFERIYMYEKVYGASNIKKAIGIKGDSLQSIERHEYMVTQDKRMKQEHRKAVQCNERNEKVPEPTEEEVQFLTRYIDGHRIIYYKRKGKYVDIACAECGHHGRYIMSRFMNCFEDTARPCLDFVPEHNLGGEQCPECGTYAIWKAAGLTKTTQTKEDHSMITPVTKIEDIRALKRFEKQEPEAVETKYEELFKDFFNGKEKELNAVFLLELKEAVEIINPMNNRTHKYKMLFMAMKEYEKGIDIKDLLKPVPEHLTWESFIEQSRSVFTYDNQAAGTPYEQNYPKESEIEAEKKELENVKEELKEKKAEAKIPQTRISNDSEATLDKSSLTGNNTEKEQKIEENVTKDESKEENATSETATETAEAEKEVENPVCDIAQTVESIRMEPDSEPEILEGEVEEKTEEIVKPFESCNGIPKLKTHEKYYDDIESRRKSFSIRLNDRGYKVGDKYVLAFIDDDGVITKPSLTIRITYVLDDFIGLTDGYVAFGYEVVA